MIQSQSQGIQIVDPAAAELVSHRFDLVQGGHRRGSHFLVAEELLGDGGTVVDVGDVDAFAAALSRYVGSPDLRQTAGAVSRKRGTVIYGADALVRQVARIYEEVLGR